jgi:hypothetical protein
MEKKDFYFNVEYRSNVWVHIPAINQQQAELILNRDFDYVEGENRYDDRMDDWFGLQLKSILSVEVDEEEGDPCRPHLRLIK